MAYKVEWTRLAHISLESNLEFINKRWSIAVVKKFLELLSDTIHIIQNNPFIFPSSVYFPAYKAAKIHNNVTMYYKVERKTSTIYIMLIWPNKMNPDKLKGILKNKE